MCVDDSFGEGVSDDGGDDDNDGGGLRRRRRVDILRSAASYCDAPPGMLKYTVGLSDNVGVHTARRPMS